MDDEISIPDKARANADLVVRTFRERMGVKLTFDQAGVEWIDGYINRVRGNFTADRRSGLVDALGAFVGECIIRTFGGTWTEVDGRWGVRVSDRLWACPDAKIEKQFANDSGDSVASFFRCIPVLDVHFDQKLA